MADNQAAFSQESWEGFAFHGNNAVGRNGLDDGTLEYIATGVDLVGWRILGLF